MSSIIIAAHNEGSVIGRCLMGLTADRDDELEITVVANGCTDDTGTVARDFAGVNVIELPTPGKASALNAGDAATHGFPRLYLDADMALTVSDVRALFAALGDGVHAAVPRRQVELEGRPLVVRAYYAVNRRLPAFESGLFGRGAIAISAAGRARFLTFPDLVADDLFLDSIFEKGERSVVDSVVSMVQAPLRTRALFDRLVRVRSGNTAMRQAAERGLVKGQVRPRDTWAWLRLVLPQVRLWPAGVVYAGLTVVVAIAARRRHVAWGQDRSSRPSASGALS